MRKRLFYIPAIVFFFISCNERKAKTVLVNKYFDSVIISAEKLFDSGYKKRALHIIHDARGKIGKLPLEAEIHYFSYCNILYNNQKDYTKSIIIADSMLAVLEKTEENHPRIAAWRTVALNSKADALFNKGLYNDAYNYYFLAQKLAKENQDSCAQRSYSYSLAMTLYRQTRFRESAQKFIEAYNVSRTCPLDFNMYYFTQEVLDNIGLCYKAMHKHDSALQYYRMALDYLNEHTGKFDHKQPSVYEAPKAVVYGNMADVYMNTGKYDSAKILFEHSISINLQKGYTNFDALADQVKLADLYFKTGEISLGKVTLDNIKAELDSLPDARVEMMWNKLMWQYSEYVKDSISSYRHLRMFTLQGDAYEEANRSLMETDLDMRVKDMEKQYKINLLTKDKQQQKIYMAVLAVLAVMACVIIFLVLRNARRSLKNVKQLTLLNDTVNRQKEQLEMALAELHLKEKDKARILKSVAHDVMNPIAAIVSLADILLHDEEQYTEEQQGIINLIKEASNNSLSLSRDILEASENINEAPQSKERTDISLLVAKSVELLNFKALSKNQKIISRYPPDHIFAYVYKDKMRRVINNILANAIKFSFENSTVEILVEEISGQVHIAIKDSGVGIPEKNKPLIFDMFTEVKMAGTSGERPHGLGLSISLQIARAHKGDIWFESEEGKGSVFHLVFPIGEEGDE